MTGSTHSRKNKGLLNASVALLSLSVGTPLAAQVPSAVEQTPLVPTDVEQQIDAKETYSPSDQSYGAMAEPYVADPQSQGTTPPTPTIITNEQSDEEEEQPVDDDAIVVVGRSTAGSLVTDTPAEYELDTETLKGYGASSIDELLDATASITQSGRGSGRPVVLVNGRRVSSFREIRRIPPEAIEKMEVYPEEVAVSQGYKPHQRVVNFILKKDFRAITVEAEYGMPTDGGYSAQEFEVGLLKLETNGRLQLNAEVNRSSPLYASERDLDVDSTVAVPVGTTAADFDTLRSKQLNVELEGTYQRYLTDDISGTLNLTYETSNSDGASGPSGYYTTAGSVCDYPSALLCDGQIDTENRTRTFHAGTGFNGDIGRWRWNFSANHDRTNTTSRSDRTLLAGENTLTADENVSKGQDVSTDATAVFNGPLAELPAGPIRASMTAGFVARDYEGWSDRASGFTTTDLDRQEGTMLASLDIPIASAKDDVLPFLGRLSLNTNFGYDRISDFGGLVSYGAGFNWGPTDNLNLSASISVDEDAPSMTQLGSPVVETDNRTVYDYVTGQSVLVTSRTGGNANLLAPKKREWKLGASYEAPWVEGLRLSADYYNNHTDNPIGSLPALTEEVQLAFPDRFIRDGEGNLLLVDYTPINYDASDNSNIRYGISFFKSFGEQPQRGGRRRGAGGESGGEGGPPPGASGGPREGGGRGMGRGGMGGPGGGAGGRWNLSLFHTIKLTDTVDIGPGLPQLDLLNGDATGNNGGSSRHVVDLDGGWSYKGFGLRGNAKYQSGSTVIASDEEQLRFHDHFTVNLMAFVNFDQQPDVIKSVPFLKGSRIRLSLQNAFNSIQKVTDSTGEVPTAYQPAYMDSRGRYFEIDFRKMF